MGTGEGVSVHQQYNSAKCLGSSLEREHLGAAASLREGLAGPLTLMRFGVSGWLYRALRSTNIIESVNSSVPKYAHNVRRWPDGEMIVRWVAPALSDAESRFNKLKGTRTSHASLRCLTRTACELQ